MDCYCPAERYGRTAFSMALFYVLCGWAIAMLTIVGTLCRMDKERKR